MNTAQKKEYDRLRYLRLKPRINAQVKKYNRDNKKEKLKASARRWYNAHRNQLKNSELMRRYGIALVEYQRMALEQRGLCKICHKQRKLHVEHNHKTGVVRGLTCNGCNSKTAWLENYRTHIFQYLGWSLS